MQPLTLQVEGMSCGHCLKTVTEALDRLDGVEVEMVQLGHAAVRYDPVRVTPDAVAGAVSAAGYPATAAPARGR